MGPIALFVVVVVLPLAAIFTVGGLWVSTWIADVPLLVVPLTLAAAAVGIVLGVRVGRSSRFVRRAEERRRAAEPAPWTW